MAGHCCDEGAREHEARAYWRRKEEERLLKASHARWEESMRVANNNPNWPDPRIEPQPTVSIWSLLRWLFRRD